MYVNSIDMGHDRTRANLRHIFQTHGVPNVMIEIGCFEGATTFWVSDLCRQHNQQFHLYAIDPHSTVNDNHAFDFDTIKRAFEYNLSVCLGQVTYINKYSHQGLVDLINQNVQAELIYVDGDHTAAAVLEDMILGWRLLSVGGVMLCDDAIGWKLVDQQGQAPVQLSPRMGIEMFVQTHWHKIELIELPNSFQTAFVKIAH
jgi:cephalosporin hydroxylase